jgi:hypothetical protein
MPPPPAVDNNPIGMIAIDLGRLIRLEEFKATGASVDMRED